MSELETYTTEALIRELKKRSNVKYFHVESDQYCEILAKNIEDFGSRDEMFDESGTFVIVEVA